MHIYIYIYVHEYIRTYIHTYIQYLATLCYDYTIIPKRVSGRAAAARPRPAQAREQDYNIVVYTRL